MEDAPVIAEANEGSEDYRGDVEGNGDDTDQSHFLQNIDVLHHGERKGQKQTAKVNTDPAPITNGVILLRLTVDVEIHAEVVVE
jgi:hypothetical protein